MEWFHYVNRPSRLQTVRKGKAIGTAGKKSRFHAVESDEVNE